MYRAALRSSAAPASALHAAIRPTTLAAAASRRFASTSSDAVAAKVAKKKGTWKGTALRWGLAIAAVYFYNTSPLFADEIPATAGPAPSQFSESDLPTIDALIEQKRKQAAAAPKKQPAEKPQPPVPAPSEAVPAEAVKAIEQPFSETETKTGSKSESTEQKELEPGSPEALEHEAKEQGAFDPETGEINWDCPCLGGMAHGPCGEEFKAAFSCFVYSKEEPKGMDCIEKFQAMQDCFRKYPDVYAAELADDQEEDDAAVPTEDAAAEPRANAADGEKMPSVTEAVKEVSEVKEKKEEQQ